MNSAPCALFFVLLAVAWAHSPDEIDLIRAHKGKKNIIQQHRERGGGKKSSEKKDTDDPNIPINEPRSTACTVRQLNATMLIAKVRS